MSIEWIFTLKRTGRHTWVLLSHHGVTLLDINASTLDQAYDRARAYASSWNSVSIKVEDEQQCKKD